MAEKLDQQADGLPSYSESVSSAYSRPLLPRNFNEARTVLISNLIDTHISTHLHSNALSGLSNTILLIVPANVSSLQPSHSSTADDKPTSNASTHAETIVGFASAENPTLIRLQGQENSLGFWCQPAVICELQQRLGSQLKSEGYEVADSNEGSVPDTKAPGSTSQPTRSAADWRTTQRKRLRNGEARVEVGMQDISLRSENAMGLFETKTGTAMVVKVEFGG